MPGTVFVFNDNLVHDGNQATQTLCKDGVEYFYGYLAGEDINPEGDHVVEYEHIGSGSVKSWLVSQGYILTGSPDE